MRFSERGTSLIEILLALTILSVGLLGLVGTSAMVSRLLGQGRRSTVTMGSAERRIALLRARAPDSAGCAALSGGSASLPAGLAEQWSVLPGVRSVTIEVVITGRLPRPDTVSTVLPCT
jgi:type II secretory pathway component PulJ